MNSTRVLTFRDPEIPNLFVHSIFDQINSHYNGLLKKHLFRHYEIYILSQQNSTLFKRGKLRDLFLYEKLSKLGWYKSSPLYVLYGWSRETRNSLQLIYLTLQQTKLSYQAIASRTLRTHEKNTNKVRIPSQNKY